MTFDPHDPEIDRLMRDRAREQGARLIADNPHRLIFDIEEMRADKRAVDDPLGIEHTPVPPKADLPARPDTHIPCFGGPLEGEFYAPSLAVRYMIPQPLAMHALHDPDPIAHVMPTGEYRMKRVGLHDARACKGPLWHDEECRWTARCFIRPDDDETEQRVLDTLTFLYDLANLFR